MVREKILEIPKELMEPEWQTNKVKIRKWSLGIRNEIIDSITEIKPSGIRGHEIKIERTGRAQILIISKCVLEAPWNVGDINVVSNLDPAISDFVYAEIQTLNGGDEKNSNGLAESSAEKPSEQTKTE